MPCRSSRICSGDAFRFPTIGSGKFSWVLFSDQNRHHAGLLLDEDPHLIRIKLNPCSIRLHGALRLLAEIHQRRHQIVFLFPANGSTAWFPLSSVCTLASAAKQGRARISRSCWMPFHMVCSGVPCFLRSAAWLQSKRVRWRLRLSSERLAYIP